MSNYKIVDTRKLTKSDAEKGRFGDTEIALVDGQETHVTSWESFILDQSKRDGDPQLGEDIVNAVGSHTINPKTGKPERFPWIAAAGLALSAFGMIRGMGAEKRARKDAISQLQTGMKNMNEQRVKMAERATEDIGNIWENVGEKLEDIRIGVGKSYGQLSDTVSKVITKGKGLKTGAAEQMVEETTDTMQEDVDVATTNLQEEAGKNVEIYGQKMQDEQDTIARAVADMQAQMDSLSKKRGLFG